MAATEPAITYMKPPNRSVEKIKKRNAPMPPTAKHRANAIEISVGIAPLERSPPESQTMPSVRGWSPILRKPREMRGTQRLLQQEQLKRPCRADLPSKPLQLDAHLLRRVFAGERQGLFGRALQPGLELLLAPQQNRRALMVDRRHELVGSGREERVDLQVIVRALLPRRPPVASPNAGKGKHRPGLVAIWDGCLRGLRSPLSFVWMKRAAQRAVPPVHTVRLSPAACS